MLVKANKDIQLLLSVKVPKIMNDCKGDRMSRVIFLSYFFLSKKNSAFLVKTFFYNVNFVAY